MMGWKFPIRVAGTVAVASMGCGLSPCVTCGIAFYNGHPIDDFLKRVPKPVAIKILPDTNKEYVFEFHRLEQIMDLTRQPAVVDNNSTRVRLFDKEYIAGGRIPSSSNNVDVLYLLTVTVDAKGIIIKYVCEKV